MKRDALPTATPIPGQRSGALRVTVDDRAAIVAPARAMNPGLWAVSLDGTLCDALYPTKDEAVEGAAKMLKDPNCPCWLAARGDS